MFRIAWLGRGFCATALIGVLISAASAWASLSSLDDFDDNTCNTNFWNVHTSLSGSVSETNQRLEYMSSGASGDVDNVGVYRLKVPLPYDQTWAVTLDVYVEAYAAAPLTACYGMEFTVTNSADADDILWLTLDRGEDNPSAFWCMFRETNGVEVNEYYGYNAPDSGTMKLIWDGTRFRGYYDEGSGWQGFAPISVGDWGMGVGSTFTLSIGGYDNNCSFALDDGAKMYADNFVLAPEPVTPGDANLDGVVDDADLSLLLANWSQDVTGEPDGGWGKGEFDASAPVQDADLSLLLANWTGSGAIPEPASLSLLAVGAVALIRRRR